MTDSNRSFIRSGFLPAFALLVVALALSGCMHGRYTLPITPLDAQVVYPSVVSVAQAQGHEAYLRNDQLQVDLSDGSRFLWYTQKDGTVELAIWLPDGVPPSEEHARLATAKQQADKLWQDAITARQQYGGSDVVIVAPVAPAFGGGGAAAMPGSMCRTGADGAQACGYDCRIGSRGRAYCASTPDGRCALNSDGSFSCGRDCKLQAGGWHDCK